MEGGWVCVVKVGGAGRFSLGNVGRRGGRDIKRYKKKIWRYLFLMTIRLLEGFQAEDWEMSK